MIVAIRADASTYIGIGHIMRCLTLADEMKPRGADVVFVSRNFKGNLQQPIEARGYKTYLLPDVENAKFSGASTDWIGVPWQQDAVPWQQDAAETIECLQDLEVNLLVVDHYGIDQKWHKLLRPRAKKLWVIDDLANRVHDCDLLLDQTFERKRSVYEPLVPKHCKLLLGSHYALLRNEFRQLRGNALRKREGFNGIQRILITMGGTDPSNVTECILGELAKVKSQKPIKTDVVLASNAPYLEVLRERFADSQLPIRFHVDASNMGELMLQADLAVGAGGATSWERCCMGLPTFVTAYAQNQSEIVKLLEKQGAVIRIGRNDQVPFGVIAEKIAMLNSNTLLYQQMALAASDVCDGRGTSRVVTYLENMGN